MKIQGTYLFEAPPAVVWQALFEPEVLAKTLPGCEKLEREGDQFKGELNVKMGPVQGKFQGKVDVTNIKPLDSYTMLVDGRGPAGFVKATAQLKIVGAGSGTRLEYESDVQVGGRVASVGQRLLDASSRAIVKQSLEGLHQQIKALAAHLDAISAAAEPALGLAPAPVVGLAPAPVVGLAPAPVVGLTSARRGARRQRPRAAERGAAVRHAGNFGRVVQTQADRPHCAQRPGPSFEPGGFCDRRGQGSHEGAVSHQNRVERAGPARACLGHLSGGESRLRRARSLPSLPASHRESADAAVNQPTGPSEQGQRKE
jgi:carbon monoxide dehydrogenase subunit G